MSNDLGWTPATAAQSNKITTINEALSRLDAALTQTVTLDVTSANLTPTADTVRLATALLIAGATTAGRTITMPTMKRSLDVIMKSDATQSVSLIYGTATVILKPGQRGRLIMTGTANVMHFFPYAVGLKTGDLADIDESTPPTAGQTLVWDATSGKFKPGTIGGALPAGGTTGQVLAKKSATDGDVLWEDPPTGTGGGTGSGAAVPLFSASYRINAASVSGGAQATKGNVVAPTRNVSIYRLAFALSALVAGQYRGIIGILDTSNKLSGVTFSTVVSVAAAVPNIGWLEFLFPGGVIIQSGQIAYLAVNRSDGSDTYVLPVAVDQNTVNGNPAASFDFPGQLAAGGSLAMASPNNGSVITRYSPSSVLNMSVSYN